MSTHQIVDLDAAIAEHKALEGSVPKEIQIFGRVWTLAPVLTTVTLNPLMKMQQVAEAINEGKVTDVKANQLQMAATSHLLDTITSLVIAEERDEFRDNLQEKGDGIPVGMFEVVLETVLGLYGTDPLDDSTAAKEPAPIPDTKPVLTTVSGNSPAPVGERLKSESQQPGTFQVAPPTPELPSTPNAESLLDEVSWA